jgi:hypothetical protein
MGVLYLFYSIKMYNFEIKGQVLIRWAEKLSQ